MPKRKSARAQDRVYCIRTERELNEAFIAERNEPPPF
jgi:hypothetical protein